MNIVAFDPGFTTGVARFGKDIDEMFETTQVVGISGLWDVLHMGAPYDRIVYESFLYQRRDKVDLRPVEAIGVIKLYAAIHDITLVAQTPATGKRFWTDEKIKKLNLWEEGQPHAMDAMRHLLYYRAFSQGEHSLLEVLK